MRKSDGDQIIQYIEILKGEIFDFFSLLDTIIL